MSLRARAAAILLVVLVGGLAHATPAASHFQMTMYSGNSTCNNWVDPVSVIFYGNADYPWRVINHIVAHTGWNYTGGPFSDQWISDHGACQNLDDQRADNGWYGSRYHVRIFQNADYDGGFGWTHHATPHYEDVESCPPFGGHAVRETTSGWSGYDMGRARLYDFMSAGHYTWTEVWGNTAWMFQCDGGAAYSNGVVRYFWIPYSMH